MKQKEKSSLPSLFRFKKGNEKENKKEFSLFLKENEKRKEKKFLFSNFF